MAWLETDTKKTPEQVLLEACQHYISKYGTPPTLVCVSKGFPDLNGQTPEGMTIQRDAKIPPSQLWIALPGFDNKHTTLWEFDVHHE